MREADTVLEPAIRFMVDRDFAFECGWPNKEEKGASVVANNAQDALAVLYVPGKCIRSRRESMGLAGGVEE